MNLVQTILREREVLNERRVAVARLALISGAVVLDLLAYAGWVQTTLTPPSGLTIAIDAVFLSFAAAVLLVARRPGYRPAFKYIVVTLDFAIIAMVVTLDPSIARGGAVGDWSAMVALLFVFCLNLLRFSIGATAYAAALALALFITFGWLAPPHPNELGAMTAGMVMLLLIGLSLTRSNRAMLEEATTKQMMERYLPPQLVGRLFSGGASLEPGGEARTVTLLFADIRGFTTIAERLPAEAVVDLLNAALSRLSDAVFAHHGTLDKFTGDGLMAIFGAPVARPDDAARAVAAGLAMLEAIRDLDAQQPAGAPRLAIGVGIHTGEAIVGNIGSARRLDYTAIGDAVNLASRVEGLTKELGAPLLLSRATRDAALAAPGADPLHFTAAGEAPVKGRTRPVELFTASRSRPTGSADVGHCEHHGRPS
jgi:class 3 adenylate cyclase